MPREFAQAVGAVMLICLGWAVIFGLAEGLAEHVRAWWRRRRD